MILGPVLDLFRGKAVTIPPLDGALRPNTLLDQAELLREAEAPDNLVAASGKLLYSSGNDIRALTGNKVVASFDAPVTALAVADENRFAVGLDSGRIEYAGSTIDGFNCPVALAFGGEDQLFICNGSEAVAPREWVKDLMGKGASGSVWRVNLKTGERNCLARGLAFPYGVAVDATNGRLIVSESWRHRLIAIPMGGGKPMELLGKLPGYPARIVQSPGGYLMPLFAPRNRLIEFVLQEDGYRSAMMCEVDPLFWIAPSLSASRSFLEPLQNGGVVSMGIHKPWSPSRSYGLVVALDANLQPNASYHSRANGRRHGVTSAIAHDGAIIAACQGGDAILAVAP